MTLAVDSDQCKERVSALLAPLQGKLTDETVTYLLSLLDEPSLCFSECESFPAPQADTGRIIGTIGIEFKAFTASVKALNIQLNGLRHTKPPSN